MARLRVGLRVWVTKSAPSWLARLMGATVVRVVEPDQGDGWTLVRGLEGDPFPVETAHLEPGPGPRDVEVETRDYRLTHGAEPRGRGCWAFGFRRNPNDVTDPRQVLWVQGQRTFAEAKKHAVEAALDRGAACVWVMT